MGNLRKGRQQHARYVLFSLTQNSSKLAHIPIANACLFVTKGALGKKNLLKRNIVLAPFVRIVSSVIEMYNSLSKYRYTLIIFSIKLYSAPACI